VTHGGHEFVAVVTPSDARLLHVTKSASETIGQPMKLGGGGGGGGRRGPMRVELTSCDYEVVLRIDDKEVARTTPAQFKPDVAALLKDFHDETIPPYPTVEIAAGNQSASLSHVGLWRDIYYINKQPNSYLRWGTPQKIPDTVMHLGADEYFVLGDNSLISGDARYWSNEIDLPADRLQVQPGRVPGRFMLGRAFFVYWPAGYRPLAGLPGLVPNFGDMRFIR
jgi:signal peptidase I